MAQTTNYGIPLIPEGAQDWKPKFDQIMEAVDSTLAVNQKPTATALRWGDITNGLYLEAGSLGIQTHGPLNMLGNQTLNFVLEKVATLPASGQEGQLIYDLSTDLPNVYSSGAWRPIGLNLGVGAPASGFTNLGLVVRTDWGLTKGSVVARGDGSNLVSVGPSAAGELLGFKTVGETEELAFSTIGSWVGEGLVKGQLWVGTGTDTADKLAAPTSGDLMVGDPSASTGWKFSKVADILPADDYSAASKLYANGNLG